MENIYSAPQADLASGLELERDHEFYVVAPLKFTLLYFGTLGLYVYYWFYRNWHLQRLATGEAMMPVWRAVFLIFFTHSLFGRIDQTLFQNKVSFRWDPILMASIYVLLSIATRIIDQMSARNQDITWLDYFFLPALLVHYGVLLVAQKAINLGVGDASGDSNRTLTLLNFMWLAFGLVFWIFIGIGFASIFYLQY